MAILGEEKMEKGLSRQCFIKGVTSIIFMPMLPGCYRPEVQELEPMDSLLESEKTSEPSVKETILWYYSRGGMSSEKEIEEELNRKLWEKGLPVNLEFRQYDDIGFFDSPDESVFEGADILCVPLNMLYHDVYAEMARKGLFTSWDPFLQSLEGADLRKYFPESYWKGTEVDGKVYALLNPYFSFKTYYAINKKIASKHGILEEELNGENIWELASIVYQKEKEEGNDGLIGLEAIEWNGIGRLQYPLTSAEKIGVYEEDGKWTAKFLIDIPEYREFIRKLNKMYLEGSYQEANRNRLDGNFFATFCLTYSKENAGWKAVSMLDKKLQDEWSPEDFWIIEADNLQDYRYRGVGRKTAVMEASTHKKLAMRVLAAIYEDPEMSELINYGILVKNCLEVDGGKRIECLNGDYSLYFGNPFLMRPPVKEDEERQEKIWELVDKEVSPLCGFHLDIGDSGEVWEKICSIQNMHMDTYYYGLSDSVEKEEEEIRKQLESVDGYSVLQTIEEQLNRFWTKEA